jgi:hypothetical protein
MVAGCWCLKRSGSKSTSKQSSSHERRHRAHQAAGIAGGHHFPFDDDPDAYSAAICAWWAEKVAQHP